VSGTNENNATETSKAKQNFKAFMTDSIFMR